MFKRRETIPLKDNILWQITAGAVRIFTIAENGTVISLGFWGIGDVMGQPLIFIQPCWIECLTNVEAAMLKPDECWNLNQIMLSHLHQTQELLRIRHGQIQQRMQLFLKWLGYKFGSLTEQGQLIQLRLTHQEMADAIGTTRVTITRLLQQLEQEQVISWSRDNHIVIHHLSYVNLP
jgi:CRP-like cAMP-binding protein